MDVSFLIPARNEVYLETTIRDILRNIRGDSEILVALDGYLPDPQIDLNDKRVIFVHYPESIGQRQCVNALARMANGKYICKLDAHCAIDEGMDIKLMADCEYDWTVIPRMYNLDHETWKPKLHKLTDYMYIGCDQGRLLRAEYYGSRQPKTDKLIDDTMCCMGPGFFMHKDRFWELGGLDEKHGGWGQMGVEVACKAWLSGGALKVNKKTWFSHWFRGGSGPGFPYKISGNDQERARKYSRDLWLNNKWEKQTRQFQWMVDKFNPPGWVNDLTLIYYTANVISSKIADPVIRSLKRHGYPIISVSQDPMDLGTNIVVPKERSMQNIYKQVLIGAKKATTKYVALCEDDCLYLPDHFKYRPTTPFGYNINRWLLHLDEGVYSYRKRPILSQCIAAREILIKNLEERMAFAEIPDKYCGEMGVFDKKLGMKEYGFETFETKEPNLVICHRKNIMGRKLLGEDAELKTELAPYGKVDYWLAKFGEKQEKVHKQVSYIAGKVYEVDDLLSNIEKYWDYRKQDRVKFYKSAAIPFFEEVHAGKTFTDEELIAHPYFEYLKYRMREEVRETEETKQRCLYLIKSGIGLYHDIKNNGMYHPIDMFWKEDRIYIYRGSRRLIIAKLLGYKTITARVFKSLDALGKLMPNRDDKPNADTIHGLAMMQFNKYDYKGTDKFWTHGYTPTYDFHLSKIKTKAKKILELGVFRGASLLLWHDYFKEAQIFGMDRDVSKASMVNGVDRITLLQGRQEDPAFFKNKVIPSGKFDLIIDDCSHRSIQQKETFELLWDSVNNGGFYVIEDMYWRGIKDPVAMDKFKALIDEMNSKNEIASIHFYYNIVFIEKR